MSDDDAEWDAWFRNATKDSPVGMTRDHDEFMKPHRREYRMNHTPGPWETHQEVDGRNSVRVCKSDSHHVRGCHAIAEAEILGKSRLEAEANARLIAAAPELLEACKDLVERFLKCAVLAGTDKEFAEIAVASHRAAIAKAEGQR